MPAEVRELSSTQPRLNWPHFIGTAFLCILAIFLSTELHESLHWIVGHLAGLPAHFLGPTTVGVTPEVAANAAPSDLAFMNGVAPLATMALGLLALAAVPRLRAKAPVAVTEFLAWCAIFAVPYIGLQTMLAAAPIRVRGDGADAAAVLGGYFGLSLGSRTAISVIGLLLYVASGFWLRTAVSDGLDLGRQRDGLMPRLRSLSVWRIVAASILCMLSMIVSVKSVLLLRRGQGIGLLLLLEMAPFLWAAALAFLVRWRDPVAGNVLLRWICPGLLACTLMVAFGVVSNTDDYSLLGELLLLPLVAAAW